MDIRTHTENVGHCNSQRGRAVAIRPVNFLALVVRCWSLVSAPACRKVGPGFESRPGTLGP
jgi:hypothetical protein